MSLEAELAATYEGFHRDAPAEVSRAIKSTAAHFAKTYDVTAAIEIDTEFPKFSLQNAVGKLVSREELLSHGPFLMVFYRGEWCPYCNVQLQHLQRNVDKMTAKGVTLVAVSPELPNQSLNTTEKHDLKFQVLSDVGNKLARQLGIVWAQPDELRGVFSVAGVDLKARNGDDSFEVPVPATFLVDQKGVVRNKFIDSDYTKRLEPATALEWMDILREKNEGGRSN